MLYKLSTKDETVLIKANSRDEAFAKFFKDIKSGKISLDKVGNIVMLNDGHEDYPFRTVPSLFILGIIDEPTAIANIQNAIENIDETEAGQLLYKAVEKDKWIYEAVIGNKPVIWPPTP